ncbi:hypothetical protein SNE40_004026 [Patella caerulea]|uniref:Pasha n=2 Tax=Patella caerulea TaxID=87958 RepID=A0AAN8KB10_PATCE
MSNMDTNLGGQNDDLEDGEVSENPQDIDSECLEPPAKMARYGVNQPSTSDLNDFCKLNSTNQPNLHEFEIIDEIENEEMNENEDSDDEYLDDNELYDLLDQGLDGRLASSDPDKDKDDTLEEKEKIVLQEKGHNPFDILPEGWVVVTHNSGMPVYLHKETRVCTMSRPYFLGPGSVRRHDIPVSAIPCLQYRRAMEKESEEQAGNVNKDNMESDNVTDAVTMDTDDGTMETQERTNGISEESSGTNENFASIKIKCEPDTDVDVNRSDDPTSCTTADGENSSTKDGDNTAASGSKILPDSKVRIETLSERKQDTSLDSLEVREYCGKLFEFKSITVKKWKTWKDRRIHMKKQFRPELPSNTKLLITCPVPPTSKTGMMKSNKLKEFVLNPSGKSYICILHEYIQHTMRVQPRYKYKELENSMTPFSATVIIEEIEYGTGYASSKKAAKLQAAKATLEILIPDMNKVTQDHNIDIEDLSFFDEVKIEDPRVYELGNKAGQPSPYQILDECLKRNYGLGDTKCTMNMKLLKHQKSEFTLTVGKHTASVIAKNKRDGKQRAAQAILQLLHPHVSCWGSLLRLYGKSSVKGLSEKKEELPINQLQNQPNAAKPCLNILHRLKKEMMKLHAEKGSIKSKGKLHIETQHFPKKVPNLDL